MDRCSSVFRGNVLQRTLTRRGWIKTVMWFCELDTDGCTLMKGVAERCFNKSTCSMFFSLTSSVKSSSCWWSSRCLKLHLHLSYSAICSCVFGLSSSWRSTLMERCLLVFVKSHHVSLSRDPLAPCWAAHLLQHPCTPSTALAAPAGSAVQLSCSTFKHPLRDSLPRPHGVPHRGHRVRAQQTPWRGWGGAGGKRKHRQVTLITLDVV